MSMDIVRDAIRRVVSEHECMKTQNHVLPQISTACQCPSCAPIPARTYTPEYMQECLARWYVNATITQREVYLSVLRKQQKSKERLAELKAVAVQLGLPTDGFP